MSTPRCSRPFTFAALGGLSERRLFPFVAVLGLWQLALGLRNILLHQLVDLEHDRATGHPYLGRAPWEARSRRRLLRRVLVPAELGLFAAYVCPRRPGRPHLRPRSRHFLALETWIIRVRWRRRFPSQLREFLFNYVDDFYVEWIPVLILLELAIRDPAFLVLLAVHVLLFPKNALRRMISELRPRVRRLTTLYCSATPSKLSRITLHKRSTCAAQAEFLPHSLVTHLPIDDATPGSRTNRSMPRPFQRRRPRRRGSRSRRRGRRRGCLHAGWPPREARLRKPR